LSHSADIAPQILAVCAEHPIRFALGSGFTYRVLTRSRIGQEEFVKSLAQSDLVAVVPPDGGFLGNLCVWDNLLLPAAYHGRAQVDRLQLRAAEMFVRAGGSADHCMRLCSELPERLSLVDRRRAALVRAMLTEPELIVFESLFDGLSCAEVEEVRTFDNVFHLYFPFRTSVWVDRDTPGLPQVAAQEAFVIED